MMTFKERIKAIARREQLRASWVLLVDYWKRRKYERWLRDWASSSCPVKVEDHK